MNSLLKNNFFENIQVVVYLFFLFTIFCALSVSLILNSSQGTMFLQYMEISMPNQYSSVISIFVLGFLALLFYNYEKFVTYKSIKEFFYMNIQAQLMKFVISFVLLYATFRTIVIFLK